MNQYFNLHYNNILHDHSKTVVNLHIDKKN